MGRLGTQLFVQPSFLSNQASLDAHNQYEYDHEGNVTRRVTFPDGPVFSAPAPNADWIEPGQFALDDGWYRLILDSLEATDDTFTLELWHNWPWPSATLLFSHAVDLSTDTGLVYFDFYLGQDYAAADVSVHLEDGVGDPNATDGRVVLARLGTLQDYEWDYHNRLTKAEVSKKGEMGSGLIILPKAGVTGMLTPCPDDHESQLEDMSTTC